jgi:hypothetical protein
VVGPAVCPSLAGPVDPGRIRRAYTIAVEAGLTRKEALKAVAEELGAGRREVFDSLVVNEITDE